MSCIINTLSTRSATHLLEDSALNRAQQTLLKTFGPKVLALRNDIMLSKEPWLEIRLRPVPSVALLMMTSLAGRFTPVKGFRILNNWSEQEVLTKKLALESQESIKDCFRTNEI